MKFKFNGVEVSLTDTGLICGDEGTRDMLIPLIGSASGGPEHGDPFLNLIAQIFGRETITDIEADDDGMIY